MPLAQWVEQAVVDPLTEGRHRLLRETTLRLTSGSPHDSPFPDPRISTQLDLSLHTYPLLASHLALLKHLPSQKLDMAALIRKPEELFVADESWSGAKYMEEERKRIEKEKEAALVASPEKGAADYLAFAIQSHREAEHPSSMYESREVLEYALGHSADEIAEMARKKSERESSAPPKTDLGPQQTNGDSDDRMNVDEDEPKIPLGLKPIQDEEDATLKRLRLNLLALAKRAPLDSIARIPVDLVPEHIRHVVPTIESTPSSSSASYG